MNNAPGQYTPDEINHVFANLQPHDVEQFYAVYQQWLRQRNIANLQAQIESIRNQIAENNMRIQQVQPSSIALSIIARLQSNGVTNPDLLDRMLDRGEAWLESTMQHLDYCEQFDFIRGNYTEWCEHALEGAYDWIDSMQELDVADVANNDKIPTASTTGPTPTALTSPQPGESPNEATEEIFLQKLMSEEDLSLLDTAQEIGIVSSTAQEEALVTPTPLEDQDTAHIQATGSHAAQSVSELSIETHSPQEVSASSSVDATDPTHVPLDEPSSIGLDTASISHTPVEETSAPVENISDATASDEILSSMTANPADIPAEVAASSVSTEPAPFSAQIEQQPAIPASTTAIDEGLHDASSAHHEQTSAADSPSNLNDIAGSTVIPSEPVEQTDQPEAALAEHASANTVDTAETSATPPLPLEQAVTAEPKEVEHEAVAAHVSAPPSPSPAAQSPRKRNFLQRLFSIFSRRKPNK